MIGFISYMIFLVAVIFFSVFVAYKTWPLGNKPSDYRKICLEGHTYFRANYLPKALMSIKLDDDGKPVLCDDKTEVKWIK